MGLYFRSMVLTTGASFVNLNNAFPQNSLRYFIFLNLYPFVQLSFSIGGYLILCNGLSKAVSTRCRMPVCFVVDN
jgi:hypothetical protein